jgi:hypothetical protein
VNPILINTGRSTSGWSFWGPAFSCDFLWFLINVKGKQFIGADPLTQGSMGHTILAHYYARLGCEQGGFKYEGEMVTDPDYFLPPEEGLRAWVEEAEKEGTEAAHFIANTLEVFRRYRQREPYVSDRVEGVEMQIKMTVGRNSQGDFGLWLDENLDKPELLDCPGLEEPTPGVPALQHGKPIVVTKRFDLVMTHSQDQRTYIWDHKVTGGSVSKTRAQQYAMDGQFAVNRIAGRQLYGSNFGGVVLNLVQRREPYAVSRQHVPATPWRDQQFARQVYTKAHSLAQQLVMFAEGQTGPGDWELTQSELACYHRYGKCGAFEICQYGPEEGE